MPRSRGGAKGACAAKPASGAAAANAKLAAPPAAQVPVPKLPARAETPSSAGDASDSDEGEWETVSDEEEGEDERSGDDGDDDNAAHAFTLTALRAASVHLVDDTEEPRQCAPGSLARRAALCVRFPPLLAR
jgi:hypothetical protein